jgi:hypothetical protein
MSRAARFFLPVLLLATLPRSGSAKGPANSPPVMRSIVVSVFDARGSAIAQLSKESFRVRLNGKPVAVLDARYSVAPRRIVILLDMSGSMIGDNPKWMIARDAVEDLLAQAPADAPVAMLTFAGGTQDVFDFPQGHKAIAKWLEGGPTQRPSLKQPARTALFDGILEALRLLGAVQPGDAIYAITDGGENASHASAAKARAAILQSGTRLFTFLFAEDLEPVWQREYRNFFLSIVDDSGGLSCGVAERPFRSWFDIEYAYGKDAREKAKLCTQGVGAQVRGSWTLDIETPPPERSRKVRLEVVSSEGRARKDVGIAYPRFLFAPK